MPVISISDLFCAVGSALILALGGIGIFLYLRAKGNNRFSKVLAILLSVTLLTLCVGFWMLEQSSKPSSSRFEPSVTDIAGVYLPLDRNTNQLKEFGYTETPNDSSITFNSDKSFSGINVPNVIWGFDNENTEFVSCSGTWNLEDDIVNGEWILVLQFTEIGGSTADTRSTAYLSGEKPPYRVYFSLSEMIALVYEKR